MAIHGVWDQRDGRNEGTDSREEGEGVQGTGVGAREHCGKSTVIRMWSLGVLSTSMEPWVGRLQGAELGAGKSQAGGVKAE